MVANAVLWCWRRKAACSSGVSWICWRRFLGGGVLMAGCPSLVASHYHGGGGDEHSVRCAERRLVADGEAGLGQQPLPVLARVLVVHGEQAEGPPQVLGPGLAQPVPPPGKVALQRLARPVVEQEE